MQRCQHTLLPARSTLPLALQRMLRTLPRSHPTPQHDQCSRQRQHAGPASASAPSRSTYGPLPPPAPTAGATTTQTSTNSSNASSSYDSPDFDDLELDDDYYREIGMTREEVQEEMMWHAADLDPDGMELSLDGVTRPDVDPAGLAPELRDANEKLEVYGPEALVLAGFRAEELGMIRATLDSVGGHAIKVLPANEQMLHGTVEAAVHASEIDWLQPRPQEWVMGGGWGAQRAILFSGLGIKAQATVLELLESAGLPTICVTMALEEDAQRSVGEVLALAVKDQRKLKVPKGELWDVPGRMVNDTQALQPVEQVVGKQRAAERFSPQQQPQVNQAPKQQQQQPRPQQPQQRLPPRGPLFAPKQQQQRQLGQQQQQQEEEDPTHVAGLPLDNLDDDALLAWFNDPSTGPMFEMPMDGDDPAGAAAAAAAAGTGLPDDAVGPAQAAEAAGAAAATTAAAALAGTSLPEDAAAHGPGTAVLGPAGASWGSVGHGTAEAAPALGPVVSDISAAESRLLQTMLSGPGQPQQHNSRNTSSTASNTSTTTAAGASDDTSTHASTDTLTSSRAEAAHPVAADGSSSSTPTASTTAPAPPAPSPSLLDRDAGQGQPVTNAAAGQRQHNVPGTSGRGSAGAADVAQQGSRAPNVPSAATTPSTSFSLDDVLQPRGSSGRGTSSSGDLLADLLDMAPPARNATGSRNGSTASSTGRSTAPSNSKSSIGVGPAASSLQPATPAASSSGNEEAAIGEDPPSVLAAIQAALQRGADPEELRQAIDAAYAAQRAHEQQEQQQQQQQQQQQAQQQQAQQQQEQQQQEDAQAVQQQARLGQQQPSRSPQAKKQQAQAKQQAKKQYGPAPPPPPSSTSTSGKSDPLLSLRPEAKRALEGKNVQYVDLSRLPSKYRQQYTSEALQQQRQQQQEQRQEGQRDSPSTVAAGASKSTGASDDGLLRFPSGTYGVGAQKQQEEMLTLTDDGEMGPLQQETEEQQQQQQRQQEEEEEDEERTVLDADTILKLQASAREQGLDLQRLLAEAMASGMQVSAEAAKAAGVALPSTRLVEAARRSLLQQAKLAAAEDAAEEAAAAGAAADAGAETGAEVDGQGLGQGWGPVVREGADWQLQEQWQAQHQEQPQQAGGEPAQAASDGAQAEQQQPPAAAPEAAAAGAASANAGRTGKARGRGRLFGKQRRSTSSGNEFTATTTTSSTSSNGDGSSTGSTYNHAGDSASSSDGAADEGTLSGIPTLEPSRQTVPGGASVVTRSQLAGVAARLGVPLEQLLEDARAKGIEIPDE